ncbi:MAG: metallophosphoesterase [Clostridia bacterium]|nr:metallophosphoesterase [Clostridia bacterium]
MAKKKSKLAWRERAKQLYAEGVDVNAIPDVVYEEYKSDKVFKGKTSAKNTISRFLRETYPPKPKTFEERIEAQKSSIVTREEKKRDKKLLTKIAVTDMIIDATLDALKARPLREIKPFEVNLDRTYSEETIVLMISDIQAGTYISSEASGGLNEYNWSILEKQFDQLYIGLEEIVTRHKRVAPIKSLHVHLIGDIVEGYDIFKGQTRQIDTEITEQAIGVKDLLCDFLQKALHLFDKIHVVAVPGNHGRIGTKGENLHYVSWDYIVYKWMQSELKNFDSITWQITKSWWQIDTIYGYNFLMFHGDDIKSWQGIPYYGIDRAAKNYHELLELLGLKYNYLEIGHFHVPSELSGVTTEKFINGCWPGGSLYSMKGLVTANYPVQKLFAVHPTQGVTYRYPIKLTLPKKRK